MSKDKELFAYKNILSNMSDGVLTINLHGEIVVINQAAIDILGLSSEAGEEGKTFDDVFAEYDMDENDPFFYSIIQATYSFNVTHNRLIEFHNPNMKKVVKLSMATSFLQVDVGDEKEVIGVIAVFRDITEINDLRDALKAMEEIKKLNDELDKRNKFIRKIFGKYMSDEVVDKISSRPTRSRWGATRKG